MNNQGLFGALDQYWTVNEKPRLHRRNTYFEDHPQVSHTVALKGGLIISVLAMAIVFVCSITGVVL